MNISKKIYCRIFQTAFKIAIPILPYRTPQTVDKIGKVPNILTQNGFKKVLVITDENLNKIGLLDSLKTSLNENEIEYIVYDKTVVNPTVENVEIARKIYIDNGCEAIIGFGGGSPIDCAKAVGARIARPKKPLSKMEGILGVLRKIPFLIAIPTTAGTGSETTLATVITDEKSGHKFPISDFCLIPKVAVLDPSLTRNLPKSLVATTGMDALTHAVEAYIGRSTVKSTRKASLDAVRLISENLQTAYDHPENETARENMLNAAFLAGSAFSKSYVGYCHAVAHSLGGKYNIPHGLANAVLLPYVLRAYGNSIYKKGKKLAVAMRIVGKDTPENVATQSLIDWIVKANEHMNIPNKLKGIAVQDIPELAKYADKEANPLYPVPKLMDAHALEQFYYDVKE